MSNESSYPLGFKIFVAIVIAIVALCIYQSDFSPSLIMVVSIVVAIIAIGYRNFSKDIKSKYLEGINEEKDE